MLKIKGFCDLCIPLNRNIAELIKTLNEVVRLGYKVVAIEEIYNDQTDKNVNKASRGSDIFPEPFKSSELDQFNNKLIILSRLTIVYGDSAITHSMNNSANLKKFQIIAGRPTNETALNHCCSTFSCDLISLSSDECDINVSRKNYSIATRRGLYFEIQYCPAIIDTQFRKKTIIRSHKYHVSGKSKNIIITSAATNSINLRSPYDIANLGLIFGLSEEQSKHSIRGNCRDLILQAAGRLIGKTIIFAKDISKDISDDDSSSSDTDEIEEVELKPPKRQKIEID